MSDAINPKHYKSHPSGIEAIEICQHLDFCVGNAVKYLFRAGLKDPKRQDLQKAAWYLRQALYMSDVRLLPFDEKVWKVRHADAGLLGEILEMLWERPANIRRAIARIEYEVERIREGNS